MQNHNRRLDETEIQLAIADLQGRMGMVEQGVSNFRAFQKDARDFFTNHAANEANREKLDRHRARIHFALLGGLIALVTGCSLALFSWVLNGHHVVSDVSPISHINAPQDATAGPTHY